MNPDYVVTPSKKYWLREEMSIAEDLLSYVPYLTEEFLDRHDDFINGDFAKGQGLNHPVYDQYDNLPEGDYLEGGYSWRKGKAVSTSSGDVLLNRKESWKVDPIKYTDPTNNLNFWLGDEKFKYFPTATMLTKKYGDDCMISSYSIIESQSHIPRHTGSENRDREYLRIHIPLIVPEGDIFFECEGVEIDWSDIFGFDNQLIHSAYNYSPYRRLVFLIDIKRSLMGIPIGEKYDVEREKHIPPFVRGALPKVLHTCQK
jgi:hypothetical protein